jgi:hypothetical protein
VPVAVSQNGQVALKPVPSQQLLLPCSTFTWTELIPVPESLAAPQTSSVAGVPQPDRKSLAP